VVFLCLDCGVALADDPVRNGQNAIKADEARVEALPLSAPLAADDGTRLPATELAPALPGLPAELAVRKISFEETGALAFPALVRRLAALSGVAMRIEERPARIAGGGVALADPPQLSIAWHGQLGGLLDRTAALAGYDWAWHGGAVVFHRYWDAAQRGPAAEGGGAAPGAVRAGAAPGRWTADPARHGTLRGVLEAWAARAGWTLVWNAGQDYGLGASASFAGSFLEAADLLLSGPATSRALDARAYRANRHLVVGDAGGAGW